ncbi:hypothetical protein ACW2AE_00670 [Limosilactobacillus fermentum]
MLTWAFNQVRGRSNEAIRPNTREYRALNKSWRLYLLKGTSLNYTKEYWTDRHLRQKVTMAERVWNWPGPRSPTQRRVMNS